MSPKPERFGMPRSTKLLAVVILATVAGLSIASISNKSPTFDEPFHLMGGYSYWTQNDFRVHPTNGNIVQRWISLPLLTMDLKFPALDQEAWRFPRYHGIELARQLLYSHENNLNSMICLARLMIVGLYILLCCTVYLWSSRLFGYQGALISLCCVAFCPTMIAHGRLATSDVACSLAFLLAAWAFWSVLERVTLKSLAFSSFASGLVCVTKFSAPLLAFLFPLLILVRLVRRRPMTLSIGWFQARLSRIDWKIAAIICTLMFNLMITWLVIWACYGFRYAAAENAVDQEMCFGVPWEVVTNLEGDLSRGAIHFAKDTRILPEAYVYGMSHTLRFSKGRPSYMLGEIKCDGRLGFYPYCYLLKFSLGFHLLVLLAFCYLGSMIFRGESINKKPKHKRNRLVVFAYKTTPLWALIAVYWTAAIASPLNLGVRHILPVIAPTAILTGILGRLWSAGWRNRTQNQIAQKTSLHLVRGIVIAALLLKAGECVVLFPHYLAYFNQIAGGPSSGYRHLVDNNLDWGQDLPSLAKWVSDNKDVQSGVPVYYSYFGNCSPEYSGLHGVSLRHHLRENVSRDTVVPLRPGIYCISATTLAGPNELIQRWTPTREYQFRRRIAIISQAENRDAKVSSEKLKELCSQVGELEYGRLLAYLRTREPDEQIGYSINIYYLDITDLREAMTQQLVEGE